MDFEGVQLLNLSPIPELSELELSTMLEQLSGLSDVNGDLTDRNVEDIIKEAEDLLDKSKSSNLNISKSSNNPETKEDKSAVVNTHADVLYNNEEPDIKKVDVNESKDNSSVKTVQPISPSTSNDLESIKKSSNSPKEVTPTKVYSPGSTCNHIKSTIDSLKEYSTLAEKKLIQSPNSSAKHSRTAKHDENGLQNKISNQLNEKSLSSKSLSKGKVVKEPGTPKKDTSDNFDKSLKLLNCFERLYQDRPVRLTACKKPKITDKISKVPIKKKLSKELKHVKKNNRQPKAVKKDVLGETTGNLINANDCLLSDNALPGNDASKISENKEKYFLYNNNLDRTGAGEGNEATFGHLRHSPVSHYQCDALKSGPSAVDEKLILKVLEEMEEIKDQVRKVGVLNDTHSLWTKKESVESIEKPKPEVSAGGASFDVMKNTDIKRLEEQVWSLKEKYDHQMEKLESENFRLREALHSKFFPPQFMYPDVTEGFSIERTFKTSIVNGSTTSKENINCKTPKNTPCGSPGYTSKEAFSQTERDVKSASSQCCQEIMTPGTRESGEGETRETENKENVAIRKKSGKWKPFSDINIHHLMKQKKIFDHESQLLATVRGLQAEITVKEKENRKLRTEVDSLRRQVNKWTNLKVDTCKKCHIGTQTIGLGPAVQKPYNPENYEASEDFQRENEELRLRLKELEEDLEILKEKRINDLQELHQVHEEEMAKAVSKLETQSALTKHLYSLLINR